MDSPFEIFAQQEVYGLDDLIDTPNPQVLNFYYQQFYEKKDFSDHAIMHLTELLEKHSTHQVFKYYILVARSDVYYEQLAFDNAYNDIKSALLSHTPDAMSYPCLSTHAVLFERLDEIARTPNTTADVQGFYQTLKAENTSDELKAFASYYLGQMLYAQNQFSEALDALRACQGIPLETEAQYLSAKICYTEKAFDESLLLLNSVIEHDHQHVDALMLRSEVYTAKNCQELAVLDEWHAHKAASQKGFKTPPSLASFAKMGVFKIESQLYTAGLAYQAPWLEVILKNMGITRDTLLIMKDALNGRKLPVTLPTIFDQFESIEIEQIMGIRPPRLSKAELSQATPDNSSTSLSIPAAPPLMSQESQGLTRAISLPSSVIGDSQYTYGNAASLAAQLPFTRAHIPDEAYEALEDTLSEYENYLQYHGPLHERVLACLNTALNTLPNHPELLVRRGYIQMLAGNLASAYEDFCTILDAYPTHKLALFYAAKCDYNQKTLDTALTRLDALIQLETSDTPQISPCSFYYRAIELRYRILLKQGRFNEALTDIEQILQLGQAHPNYYLHLAARAEIEFQKRQPEKALDTLNSIPTHIHYKIPRVTYQYSSVYRALGRHDEEMQMLKKQIATLSNAQALRKRQAHLYAKTGNEYEAALSAHSYNAPKVSDCIRFFSAPDIKEKAYQAPQTVRDELCEAGITPIRVHALHQEDKISNADALAITGLFKLLDRCSVAPSMDNTENEPPTKRLKNSHEIAPLLLKNTS